MKKISIIVPCYNEEKSVYSMHNSIKKMFKNELKSYDYELIFCDDFSTDNTRAELKKICQMNTKVKAILNAKNFGFTRNVFFSLKQGTGDACFLIFGDMQDPPTLLPEFIKKWEEGYRVVIGQKKTSEENKLMFFVRKVFYDIMDKLSSIAQIQHFNGFGLYDRAFIDVLHQIHDPIPYLKGIVSEFGMDMYILKYNQAESMRGKSNFNFSKYYDVAMQGVTSYTKILMRVATFAGFGLGVFSVVFSFYVFFSKLFGSTEYPPGIASIMIGVFFIGAAVLFFIGILGEYILTINTRSMDRPLVIIGEKYGFDDEGKNE